MKRFGNVASFMIPPSRKAKVKWQCRRGMLELDLMFSRFISKQLDHLTERQLTAFELLLDSTDHELYEWLIGCDNPADKEMAFIVNFIKQHNYLSKV